MLLVPDCIGELVICDFDTSIILCSEESKKYLILKTSLNFVTMLALQAIQYGTTASRVQSYNAMILVDTTYASCFAPEMKPFFY